MRASLSHKLEYWLGLLFPSRVEKTAKAVDKLLLEVMERVTGSHIPKQPGFLTEEAAVGEGGGGSKEDEGGELAGEDVSQRLHPEGEVLDEVIVRKPSKSYKSRYEENIIFTLNSIKCYQQQC